MNILLVDIGNTRVKWALLRDHRFVPGKPIVHDGEAAAIVKLLKRVKAVERVLAVSVAGRRLD